MSCMRPNTTSTGPTPSVAWVVAIAVAMGGPAGLTAMSTTPATQASPRPTLQHVVTAMPALNLVCIDAWLTGTPLGGSWTSRLDTLRLSHLRHVNRPAESLRGHFSGPYYPK